MMPFIAYDGHISLEDKLEGLAPRTDVRVWLKSDFIPLDGEDPISEPIIMRGVLADTCLPIDCEKVEIVDDDTVLWRVIELGDNRYIGHGMSR